MLPESEKHAGSDREGACCLNQKNMLAVTVTRHADGIGGACRHCSDRDEACCQNQRSMLAVTGKVHADRFRGAWRK